MRTIQLAAASAAVLLLSTGPLATPAAATVSAITVGTEVFVTADGNDTVDFACAGGFTHVNGVQPSPAIACSTLTKVAVSGSGANQTVVGNQLDAAAFTADPSLEVSLGGGNDRVYETAQPDDLDLGGGNDVLVLAVPGATNTYTQLGGDYDQVEIGLAAPATVSATSTGPNLTVAATSGSTRNDTILGPERLDVIGSAGADSISVAGITAASAVGSTFIWGRAGNDTLTAGGRQTTLYGETGTNVLNGGTGLGLIWTSSETDTVNGSPSPADTFVFDTDSLRAGGRTVTGLDANDRYEIVATRSDTVVRSRPATGGTTLATTSLLRSGQQVLPSGTGTFAPTLEEVDQPDHRTLVDVVAGPTAVAATGQDGATDLLDVTVPSGSWTLPPGPAGTVNVDPTDPAFASVTMSDVESYRVHGPWTDRNQGFVHRVHRDLLFRFLSDAQRDAIRTQLANGSRTRAQVTASIVSTDEYRGLDVDRVFVSYLQRPSDPSGRTYWIGSLRNGKSLRQFRAQLFGSNEYFTKSGGTNEAFMVAAYADVLGRLPDPSGQDYWVRKLNNGTERGLVARQFLASTEARRNIVKDQFLRFIDRQPTTDEATFWVSVLGSSASGEQDLVAFLANSNAYFNRS